MAELETIQTVVTQAAIQAATVVVMVMIEADSGPIMAVSTASSGQAHRQRHGGPALKQASFNWNSPGKYVEVLCFEIKVVDILQCLKHKK